MRLSPHGGSAGTEWRKHPRAFSRNRVRRPEGATAGVGSGGDWSWGFAGLPLSLFSLSIWRAELHPPCPSGADATFRSAVSRGKEPGYRARLRTDGWVRPGPAGTEKKAGVQAVLARFWTIRGAWPSPFPRVLPMTARHQPPAASARVPSTPPKPGHRAAAAGPHRPEAAMTIQGAPVFGGRLIVGVSSRDLPGSAAPRSNLQPDTSTSLTSRTASAQWQPCDRAGRPGGPGQRLAPDSGGT